MAKPWQHSDVGTTYAERGLILIRPAPKPTDNCPMETNPDRIKTNERKTDFDIIYIT